MLSHVRNGEAGRLRDVHSLDKEELVSYGLAHHVIIAEMRNALSKELAGREVLRHYLQYVSGFLEDIGYEVERPHIIYCDSDAARQMADQPTLKRRSRHISIRYRLISRSVRCMETQIIHIPGIHNPADLLTKAKFGAEFRHLWNLLMKPGDHGREPAATTSSNTESTTT